ncbi:MAG: glycosyltransferase family A protein [Patescibacteria group bacterium]
MKVSVVIPVYNEEKYVKNCLDSLMKQEKKPDEIIVVDNNCTDKTISMVKKFKDVKIIQEKKQGIVHARNAGFNAATSEILARCDADTIMPVDWIKKIKNDFLKNNKIVGITPTFYIFDIPLVNKSLIPSKTFYFFSKLIIKIPSLIGPSMVITKAIWNKIKNEVCSDDESVHEDVDLAIHISKYGQIYLDQSIIVKISGRRIKYNPLSFFIEYPLRFFKMLKNH